ncbi:MAG: tRNA (adenosine(37)-N6)-dimethylallyltransferase MiaA [Planctomycetes bacterium]|nr:tRNA (adenosine(37)-N6)-dimethylallyltransferase MiaA [Planctomycetota bacterium]
MSATRVLVLTGPTASGKTAFGLELAERAGLEIVSMDSMAVYRRMELGTAKPSASERARVPHWCLDLVEPNEVFDAARWCQAAQAVLDDARRRGVGLLFVGGTPLYLMAFFKGMVATPPADAPLRARLAARHAAEPGALHAELALRDPASAAWIHPHDEKRLVRALEVLELTGRTASEQREHFARRAWRVPCRILVFQRDRAELHERIKLRTRAMLAAGLLDETRAIRDSCGFSPTSALAIGYAECLRHLERPFKDDEELRNRIRRATHGLVRRQITWLRRLAGVARIGPTTGVDEALAIADAAETGTPASQSEALDSLSEALDSPSEALDSRSEATDRDPA